MPGKDRQGKDRQIQPLAMVERSLGEAGEPGTVAAAKVPAALVTVVAAALVMEEVATEVAAMARGAAAMAVAEASLQCREGLAKQPGSTGAARYHACIQSRLYLLTPRPCPLAHRPRPTAPLPTSAPGTGRIYFFRTWWRETAQQEQRQHQAESSGSTATGVSAVAGGRGGTGVAPAGKGMLRCIVLSCARQGIGPTWQWVPWGGEAAAALGTAAMEMAEASLQCREGVARQSQGRQGVSRNMHDDSTNLIDSNLKCRQ
jgi:hypothetical protein